jgi:DNA-binding PadR family transcriptional regulator
VSVRNSLLAILTMGPAYGFQLHGELSARTAGRRSVNVGQIYGTLERLVSQGAVESAGSTPDGFPLYRLTVPGEAEAVAWLQDTASSAGEDWTEMLERVLIASSLPHVDADAVVAGYRTSWAARLSAAADAGSTTGQAGLSVAADDALARAALSWLDTVSARLAAPGEGAYHRELSLERPKRGRRPALTPVG